MCSEMDSLEKLYLRISPNKFHYLKFVLEGYDNLAILSSYDSKQGIVLLRYPSGSIIELFSLLEYVAPYLCGHRLVSGCAE